MQSVARILEALPYQKPLDKFQAARNDISQFKKRDVRQLLISYEIVST